MILETLDNICQQLKEIRSKKSVGFVSGVFNILHTGHLRMLKFARNNCDLLVVLVLPDTTPGVTLPLSERCENIEHLTTVDYVLASEKPLVDILDRIKPMKVFKGIEFKNSENIEQQVISKYNGELIFSSGTFHNTSSIEKITNKENFSKKIDSGFLSRHNIKYTDIAETIQSMANVNLLVIGDLIVDKYTSCNPIGISREDPIVVMAASQDSEFLGGAGIVASHAANLGADVTYLTVAGHNRETDFAKSCLKENGVKATVYIDKSRRTTVKHRFRANDKTVFRLNSLDNHDISEDISNKITTFVEKNIESYDAIIFSDFNYGCLPEALIAYLIDIGRKAGLLLFADSQTSSQLGDISRYKGMTMISPTEHEIRMSLKDHNSGLVQLAGKMHSELSAQHSVITLGEDGVFIHSPSGMVGQITTDRIPALNPNAIDVAGAGDVFLVGSCLSLCTGSSIWLASLIGSLCSAIHVSTVGNRPIQKLRILEHLEL